MITLTLGFQIAIVFAIAFFYFLIKDYYDSPTVARIVLSVFMMFSYINISGAQSSALIYVLFLIIGIVIQSNLPTKENQTNHALNYFLGFFLLIMMFVLQSVNNGLVIGVPLSVEGFGLLGVSTAALAENSMFIGLFALIGGLISRFWFNFYNKVINRIPLIGLVLSYIVPLFTVVAPILTISGAFGIFHNTAYAGRVAAMFFAVSIMSIWIVAYKITGSTTPADISHFGWNFIIYIMSTGGVSIG